MSERELATFIRSFLVTSQSSQEATMDILAHDAEPRHASPQEARLWGIIGAALVIGIIALVGLAWQNDRQQMTEAPVVRIVPASSDASPIP
jgi:hypothetical protein